MRIVRNLIGGGAKPPALDVLYNGDLAVDSVTKRYKGSLVKQMDFDDLDKGQFFTFAGLATAMENVFGILEEDQALTGNYLPDDATYGMQRKKVTPLVPGSVVRAEYAQADLAGTATYDTGATGSAASSTFTAGALTTADTLIGGWIYFLNGNNADYLHYISDNNTTAAVLATALTYDVVATDDFLVIEAANTRMVDFDALYVNIKSETDDGAKGDAIVGLNTFVSAPGVNMQYLDRDKHDGVKIANAKFYHEFMLANTLPTHPIATS